MEHLTRLALLSAVAVLAAAFIGTGSAAATGKFTASEVGAPLEVTTLENHVFSLTGQTVSCGDVGFEGETEATESEYLAVTPSYDECEAFGFAAKVTPFNCRITWWILITIKYRVDPSKPCLTLIHVNNVLAQCEVTVPEQEMSSLSWSNGSGDLIVKYEMSGIEAEVTKSSGFCPLKTGLHTSGTYTGESTVKANGATLAYDP